MDRDGRLIAHTDTGLVLQSPDLSTSLAVQTARAAGDTRISTAHLVGGLLFAAGIATLALDVGG